MSKLYTICPHCGGRKFDYLKSHEDLGKTSIQEYICMDCNKKSKYFEITKTFTNDTIAYEYIKKIKDKMSLTNFERIKLMTIEELAVLIDRIQDSEREDWLSIGCHNCCNYNTHHYPNDCKELDGSVCVDMGGALSWLKRCSLEE